MSGRSKSSVAISSRLQEQLGLVLKTALSITGDKGNIQIFDPLDCSLKIVAQSGFEEEFLTFFRGTAEGHGTCGMALLRRERVIVEDVRTDPIFVGTEAQEVLLRAGVQAVQSTPMLDDAGNLVGVLSTHYRKPTRPGEAELRIVDKLAKAAAKLVGCTVSPLQGSAEHSLEDHGADAHAYSLFCRIEGGASFVESIGNWKRAIERLKALSAREPGEFVLFHDLKVLAVSRGGIVELRDAQARPAIRE